MKLVSTTALSKTIGLTSKELFKHFSEQGFIEKNDNSWVLTAAGSRIGGEYKESKQYGKYIVWPENLEVTIENGNGNIDKDKPTTARASSQSFGTKPPTDKSKSITARSIGDSFDLSATKINFILSELGWLQKGLKGWLLTEQGKKQGGLQAEDGRSGVPYVRWPETLVESKALKETIHQVKGTESKQPVASTAPSEEIGFRDKFKAEHRAADGHMVRSKAEMLIDNWLYMAEIVHAYERKLPIEEDVYTDFYIPTGKVYIEYWGYENEPKYLARKKKKIELYAKYGFNLIELQDKDVYNLDDILPRLLLKYGVQAY